MSAALGIARTSSALHSFARHFEEEEEWNTFTDEIWQKGVSLFRWGGFPPWELDLPKKGDKVVFMHKTEGTTALYLMTVIAKDDECVPYVDDIENL